MEDSSYFCNECLEVMVKKHGHLKHSHPDIGEYEVKNVIHYACETCGDKIIPRAYAERVIMEETGLRVLNALREISPISFYDLSVGLELDIRLLKRAAQHLEKDGKVFIDTTSEVPTIALVEETKDSWFSNFKSLFGDKEEK